MRGFGWHLIATAPKGGGAELSSAVGQEALDIFQALDVYAEREAFRDRGTYERVIRLVLSLLDDLAKWREIADERMKGWNEATSVAQKAEAACVVLREQVERLDTTRREIWENPEKWMRWCDERMLARNEALQAKLNDLAAKADAEADAPDLQEKLK